MKKTMDPITAAKIRIGVRATAEPPPPRPPPPPPPTPVSSCFFFCCCCCLPSGTITYVEGRAPSEWFIGFLKRLLLFHLIVDLKTVIHESSTRRIQYTTNPVHDESSTRRIHQSTFWWTRDVREILGRRFSSIHTYPAVNRKNKHLRQFTHTVV